jgi:lipid II:glycine glycyltransferase (peptidoglycan interpeptide bridge formation enzyme)
MGFRHLSDQWTTWNEPRVTMTLDVRSSESDLRRSMRESTKLYLTRATKRGAQIERHTSAAAVVRLHRILAGAGERKSLPVRGVAFFEALREQYLERGLGCAILATYEGQDLGGLLVVRAGRVAYLLYSGLNTDSEQGRSLRPGPAVHWEMIRWARNVGCETVDWGGSGTHFPPRESDAGYGIYQFKLGFGCQVDYGLGYFDLVFDELGYAAFRALERHVLPRAWRLRGRFNR